MIYWGKEIYAIRIEFQERGSPHVHTFIWIFNAPYIENEALYIEFIEKTINPQLPNHLNDPELSTRRSVALPTVDILLRKQLLQNHLILNLAMIKSKSF